MNIELLNNGLISSFLMQGIKKIYVNYRME